MAKTISLFVHKLFLENIETDIVVSQEYEIEDGMSVLGLIDSFCQSNRKLRFRFLDEQDNLRSNITIFIDSESCKWLNGLETKIKPGNKVDIFPALSGG